MQDFDVTTKAGSHTFHVLRERNGALEWDAVLAVHGGFLVPVVPLVDAHGVTLATLKKNAAQTKFECFDPTGALVGSVTFPWFSIHKKCVFHVNGQDIEAVKGDLDYVARDAEGRALVILRLFDADTGLARVMVADGFPRELALFTVAALRERRE